MANIIKAIKEKLKDIKDEREKRTIANAIKFSKENPNCVIIVADIKTDDMVAVWKDSYIGARMLTPFLHRKTGMIKTILLNREKDPAKTNEYIQSFKEFVGEFLWKIVDQVEDKKAFKVASSKGFKGNFTDFIHEKQAKVEAT